MIEVKWHILTQLYKDGTRRVPTTLKENVYGTRRVPATINTE